MYLEGAYPIYNEHPFHKGASLVRHPVSYTVGVSKDMIKLTRIKIRYDSLQSAQAIVETDIVE